MEAVNPEVGARGAREARALVTEALVTEEEREGEGVKILIRRLAVAKALIVGVVITGSLIARAIEPLAVELAKEIAPEELEEEAAQELPAQPVPVVIATLPNTDNDDLDSIQRLVPVRP
eukprot:COSAG01_NODE_61_length_29729_cov_196.711779_20_plen_119_part_00